MIDWNSPQTRLAFAEIQSYVCMYGRNSRVVRWAHAYRRMRNSLYYNVWQQQLARFSTPRTSPQRLNVLLHLRGGLGDCASNRVAVRALRKALPKAVFYFHTDSPDAMRALMVPDEQNVILPPGCVPYRRAFDMACEVCVSWKTTYVNQERVKQLAPDFLPCLQTSLQRQHAFSFFLDDNYLLDDAFGLFLYHQGASRLEALHYLSALDFDVHETGLLPDKILQKSVEKYGVKPPYITVHSGINVTFHPGLKTPLKCWPVEQWEEFLRLFKVQFPHIQIVQLGSTNSPRFAGADVCLLGKTTVAELPALLNGAQLHIDGESGLVQLTRWLTTKAVVLFGPTAPCLFALNKNINLAHEKCGHCMWLLGARWHTDCALGHPACLNMQAHTPQAVLQAVSKELA